MTQMKATPEQIDVATEYVKSEAGQKYCPVNRSNCEIRCVAFSLKSYANGMQASCTYLKTIISKRAYSVG